LVKLRQRGKILGLLYPKSENLFRNFIILGLAILLLLGCDEKFNRQDFKWGIPFVVKPGILNQDCPGQLSITMLRVENDSRCPKLSSK